MALLNNPMGALIAMDGLTAGSLSSAAGGTGLSVKGPGKIGCWFVDCDKLREEQTEALAAWISASIQVNGKIGEATDAEKKRLDEAKDKFDKLTAKIGNCCP